MKRLWMVGVSLAASVAFAVPPVIPFQGRITSVDGTPLNGPVLVIFTLYTTETGTPADIVYTETQTVTFDMGAFSVAVGATSPLMTSLFKTHSELYLGVHVGGDPQELRPLFRLATAPYAMRAASSDTATTLVKPGGAALSCAVGQAIVGADGGWSCSPMPDAYTKAEADNRFTKLSDCYWVLNAVVDGGTALNATCTPGDHVIAGGCDGESVSGAVVESFPGPSSGNYKTRPLGPWPVGRPTTDPDVPVIDRWLCRTATGTVLNTAYALCCPPR